jgi:hypothetical protein
MENRPAAKELIGNWLHSHEEDTADAFVYRPASFAFPRSRGRRGIEFRADGSVAMEGVGPDDRPMPQQGSWHLNDPGTIEISYRSASGRTMKVIAHRAGPEKLIINK